MTKRELEVVIEELEKIVKNPTDIRLDSKTLIFGDSRRDKMHIIFNSDNKGINIYFEDSIVIHPLSSNTLVIKTKDKK